MQCIDSQCLMVKLNLDDLFTPEISEIPELCDVYERSRLLQYLDLQHLMVKLLYISNMQMEGKHVNSISYFWSLRKIGGHLFFFSLFKDEPECNQEV